MLPRRRVSKQRKAVNNGVRNGVAVVRFENKSSAEGLGLVGIPIFPYKTKRTLRYFDAPSFAPGAGSAGTYVFAANGLYDPDITGTGHQPLGFDDMMLYYDHYVVTAAKITAFARNYSTANTVTIAATINGAATALTDYTRLIENGDAEMAVLGLAGGGHDVAHVTKSVDIIKYHGNIKIVDDPELRGTVAANPSDLVYFHLSVFNTVTLDAPQTPFEVVIEFDAEFIEPRKQPLSIDDVRMSYTQYLANKSRLLAYCKGPARK